MSKDAVNNDLNRHLADAERGERYESLIDRELSDCKTGEDVLAVWWEMMYASRKNRASVDESLMEYTMEAFSAWCEAHPEAVTRWCEDKEEQERRRYED